MPQASEIDHIGITALSEVLLKPAGVSLEIVYLDRSVGREPNVICYAPSTSPQTTIRLLYRP